MSHYSIKKILFVTLSLVILNSCDKEKLPISNTGNNVSPPPPPPPAVIVSCPGRSMINATLIPIGNLSVARIGMQCASAGNKIIFVGGWYYGGNWPASPIRVDIFDTSNNSSSFHFLEPGDDQYMPNYRYGAAIAAVGNKILIGGGGDYINGDDQTSQVDIYDASLNTWSKARLSTARQLFAAATVGNKILFAGGLGYPGEFATVDIYDNATNTWSTASLSQARMDLSATTVGSKIYFAGGRTGNNASRTIDIYDGASNSWSVSSLQLPRSNMASIAVDGKIFWAGGDDGFTSTGQAIHGMVERLDLNSGLSTFECIFPRKGFSAVQKNDNIIFFTDNDSEPQNQFDIYNTTTNTWAIGVLPVNIQGASIISVNNTIYVAGGRVSGSYSKQLWKLEF